MARESRRRITMGKKRHPPEEIVSKLRQVDVLGRQGTPVVDAIRAIGVTEVGRHRELEEALQQRAPACVPGLLATGPGGGCARLRRLAGSADQALGSATTNHDLTFNSDHPMGADQKHLASSSRA